MTHTLLGEWGFLDNLEDTSGNGLTATANFSPIFIDGPTAGTRAVRFSGLSDQIFYGRTGLEPTTGGIISMAWVKLFADVIPYVDLIYKTRADDSTKHGLAVHNNRIFFVSRWRDQLAFADSGLAVNDGAWHHVCNIDSDDRYAWLIDGVEVQGAPRSGVSPVSWENYPWLSGENLPMSGTASDPNVAFTGVRLLQGTMTNDEAITWMNTPIISSGPERTGMVKDPDGLGGYRNVPIKLWNGTDWQFYPAKFNDGSDWILTK